MNAKTLALVAFIAWSAICWRWYVCRIKQVCDVDATAHATQTITPIETDTVPDITPLEPPSATTTTTNNGATGTNSKATNAQSGNTDDIGNKPLSTNRLDEVQFERVEDRMVIHFPYNSIRREDNNAIEDYLSRLAEQLLASKQKVSITGHTDFVGEPKDNLTFGLRRAESIRQTLIKKGVSKSQIRCYSKGDTKPVATNDTPLGRYKNRRVEIRVGK